MAVAEAVESAADLDRRRRSLHCDGGEHDVEPDATLLEIGAEIVPAIGLAAGDDPDTQRHAGQLVAPVAIEDAVRCQPAQEEIALEARLPSVNSGSMALTRNVSRPVGPYSSSVPRRRTVSAVLRA